MLTVTMRGNAYEKLILAGGGVQPEDMHGKILAAYVPEEEDVVNPLGDAPTRTTSFALPMVYLGHPTARWTFTVLVGGQDDPGCAGLGEFRTVKREAGELDGGGKVSPNDSNIYDILVAPARRPVTPHRCLSPQKWQGQQ